ncbi:hypothetical protein PVL29_016725 [Vitis rotundifolia]|uniref:Uncharacterized protein n=1 Tax=Vitis rotundifolia TaxID=103349 RepID=A0AA38Z8W6_VITRO|nr:hypothetical protein PVL29_016725 [Vitis rotundifolia]
MVSSAAFVGEMLCNSVGFNWLACPAATELEMGSGGQKGEGFPARGFQRGEGSAGGGGFQRGRGGLAGGDDDSGRKKKNRTIRREPSGSSGSPVGPPI